MVTNLNDHLIGVVIGIRFRPNFSVEDNFGKIVDKILYSKDSYFNPEVFSITRGEVGKKILYNDQTKDNLLIDTSNLIIEVFFPEDRKGFKKEDLPLILQNVKEQIVKGIMKEFGICEIVRIGYIKRYIFKLDDLAKAFSKKTVSGHLEGIKDIDLRFSKSLATDEALMKKGVNDYDNVIFNLIKSADRKELFLSLDYQRIYNPLLPSTKDIEFDEFISKAETYNSKQCLPWLNDTYLEGK